MQYFLWNTGENNINTSEEGTISFETAQQIAKNAAENNALDLKHLHSIQALKVLVALNTQLVDNLTEKLTEEQRNELEEKGLNVNDLFTIEDSGGIRLRIDGTSYSLGNGGVVTNNFTHHNAEYNGGKSLGVDLSRTTFGVNVKNGINLQRIDVVNALLSIGIGEELIRVPQSNQAVRCDNCVGESQLIDGYSSQHFHFGSPILPQQAQYLINQLGDTNPYLQSGSENNLEYRIFNDNGVGFFEEKKWWDTSKYYGDSWSISERQNFNNRNELGTYFNNPDNEDRQNPSNVEAVQNHLKWQIKYFQNPANNYNPSTNNQ